MSVWCGRRGAARLLPIPILVDSGVFAGTRSSPLADYRFSEDNSADELEFAFWNTTIVKPFANRFIRRSWRARILFNLEQVAAMADWHDVATYTFAHILLPHPPYIFGPDGGYPDRDKLEFAGDARGLGQPNEASSALSIDQLHYTNILLEQMISRILARSRHPPIIVLQSDHGSWPELPWQNTPAFVMERMPILNALRLPVGAASALYPGITPVNNFRYVLKHCFKTDDQLIPDRIFYSNPYTDETDFADVTVVVSGHE